MKILIDCSNLQAGGGIQVAISFINDLVIMESSEEFIILMSPQISIALLSTILPNNFTAIEVPKFSYRNIFLRGREIKKMEDNIKPDIIFTVFGPSYHKSNFPKVVGFAIPHLLYSDSPFFKTLPLFERVKNNRLMKLKKYYFVKNSDALIFESDDAKNIFWNKISDEAPLYTVANTLNSIFNRTEEWIDYKIPFKGFNILFLTANYPHKNLRIIPEIIDILLLNKTSNKFKFNISVTKDELNFHPKYDKYINYLGKIKLNEVPSLYSKMDVLFMPTLLEVFSTSYLEAMHMKIPIVASDMSFARDVCNDAALYASPTDPAEYAENLIKLMNDENLRVDLAARGVINLKRFGTSMDRTKKYLEILTKHAN